MFVQPHNPKPGFSGNENKDKGQWVDVGQLKTGTYLKGRIISIDPNRPARFYIQTECEEEYSFEFSELQEQLQNYYKGVRALNISPENVAFKLVIGSCYACYHNTEWYRVLLEKFTDASKAEVLYIDLGFRLIVGVKKLQYLPKKFLNVPPQAILCQLFGVDDVKDPYGIIEMKKLKGKTITMRLEDVFVGQVGRINEGESTLHVIAYTDNDVNINDILSKTIKSSSTKNLPAKPPNSPRPEAAEWVVKVCHTFDPGRFFVRFKHFADRMKSLRQLLSGKGATLPKPEKLVAGETYVIQVDDLWHRGQYSGSLHPAVGPNAQTFYDFFLIDEGCNQRVERAYVRAISKEILDYPPMAFECSLNLETPTKNWPASATKNFKEMVTDRPLVMTVCSDNGQTLKVDLAQRRSLNSEIAIDSICNALSTEFQLPKVQPTHQQLTSNSKEFSISTQKPEEDQQDTQVAAFEFASFAQYMKRQTKMNGSMPKESDFVMAVKFIMCQSPNAIFARPLMYEQTYQKLDAYLQQEYRTKKLNFVEPEIGKKYSVYLYGHWIRGIVTDIDQNSKQYLIACMDTGQIFRLGTPLTCSLVPPFDSFPPLVVRFILADICPKPTQSDYDIIRRTNEVLLGADEVFVVCENQPKAVHFKTPVQVIFQHRTSVGTELVNFNEITGLPA